MSADASFSPKDPYQRINTSAAGQKPPFPPKNPPSPLGGGGGGGVCGNSFSNRREIDETTHHTTKLPFCQRDIDQGFCWIDDPAHINTPEHSELVVEFLIRRWKFRGVRRFVAFYGLDLVCEVITEMLCEMEFLPENEIRSPAAVLAHRVKGTFYDTSGYVGRRLLDSEEFGGGISE